MGKTASVWKQESSSILRKERWSMWTINKLEQEETLSMNANRLVILMWWLRSGPSLKKEMRTTVCEPEAAASRQLSAVGSRGTGVHFEVDVFSKYAPWVFV
jgi:hypothetical protein